MATGRRRAKPHASAVIPALVCLLVLPLAACGSGRGGDPPAPAPVTTPTGEPPSTQTVAPTPGPTRQPSRDAPHQPATRAAAEDRLRAFVEACDAGVEDWRSGQFDHPGEMTLEVNQTSTYVAAVDIRETPQPAELVLPGVGAQGEPVAVQCVLSARLLPVGDGLEVQDRSWIMRQFTPTGVLNWSWSVKALRPGVSELRLELQPALSARDPGTRALMQPEHPSRVTAFVTRVHVNANALQRSGQWWKDNWPVLLMIATGLGAAVLGLIRWGGSLGQTIREARQKWRGDGGAAP